MSLRSQLLLRLIIVSILLVGVTAWLGYKDVRNETRELFDGQLARSARLILSIAQAQNGASGFSRIQEYLDENGLSVMYIDFEEETENQQTEHGHIYETKLAFQIWDNEGNLIVKSYNTPLEPLTTQNNGFNNIVIDEFNWRTFSLLSSNQRYRCITAERIDVRNDLIVKISNDLFYMFIILVPALSLILYISIDKGLKPLQRLAAQIDRRSGDNLELITNDYKYSETVTIKNALNQLLHRLNETLSREKRITSDAAHELRTPLASIKGYATTLLAEDVEWDHQSQREFLEVISSETDRLSAMVTDLLDLSKIEAGSLSIHRTQVYLDEIIQFASIRAYPPPDGRLHVDLQDDLPELYLDKRLIETIFRNLIENAAKYAGEESPITITAGVDNGNLLVHVQDEGPGIPVQYQEHLFESFYTPETDMEQTKAILAG